MSDDLHQTASGKRRDVISWDEFFMSVAIAAQRRSKDPNTQDRFIFEFILILFIPFLLYCF